MMIKRGEIVLAAFMFSILLLGVVSAMGVSAPFWEGNPLVLDKGETRVVEINLQNMVGSDPITLQSKIVSGSEFASIVGDDLVTLAPQTSTNLKVKVSIPRNAVTGEVKTLRIEVSSVTPGNSSMVTLGTGANVGFDVKVSDETAPIPLAQWIGLAIALLVVVWIILLFFRRKKEKYVAPKVIKKKKF